MLFEVNSLRSTSALILPLPANEYVTLSPCEFTSITVGVSGKVSSLLPAPNINPTSKFLIGLYEKSVLISFPLTSLALLFLVFVATLSV